MGLDRPLLTHVVQNDHQRGDQWNGEDLSIVSVDDRPIPVSPLPKTPDKQSTASCSMTASSLRNDVGGENGVTPSNLRQTLTNPSISSEAGPGQSALTATAGYRAAEAFVRPAPVATAGIITHYTFDLRHCEFSLTLRADEKTSRDAPTVVFLPDYHFPPGSCGVEHSSGQFEISSDEEETALIQRLRWWHDAGEQTLKVKGLVRRQYLETLGGDDEGYLEQYTKMLANCVVM